MSGFEVGDFIEVIDRSYAPYPIRGTILELDDADLRDYGQAKIRVNSPAEPAPVIWVGLRMARKVS